MKAACVLLAGGEGRRMGNVNKLNITFRNTSFGEILINELNSTGMQCILSVANYENVYSPTGWVVVKDKPLVGGYSKYAGPKGGILECLKRVKECGYDGIYVVACDMPFFKKDLFERLEKYTTDHDIVIWKTNDGKLHFTCGFYSVNLIDIIEAEIIAGKFSLKGLFDNSHSLVVETKNELVDDKCFTNINDIKQLKDIM